MIKDSIVIILVVTALIMIGGYYARGYFAVGPEILVVLLLSAATYIVWKEDQEAKAKIGSRRD